MTASFSAVVQSKITEIKISQKNVLSGVIEDEFMVDYVGFVDTLVSIDLPDISEVEEIGDYFMFVFAYECTSLEEIHLPPIGAYAKEDFDYIDLGIPSSRLGILKGYTKKYKDAVEWRKLTAEGKFLYNNYIRDPALIISEEEEPSADNLVMMHLIAQAGGLM